jgi:hypothetical protein
MKKFLAAAALVGLLSGAAHAQTYGVPTALSWYATTAPGNGGLVVNVGGSSIAIPVADDPKGMGQALLTNLAENQLCAEFTTSGTTIVSIYVPLPPRNSPCP